MTCYRRFRECAALAVVNGLLARSQWFEFVPLPDGWYEIIVKDENRNLLNSFPIRTELDKLRLFAESVSNTDVEDRYAPATLQQIVDEANNVLGHEPPVELIHDLKD